MDQLIVLPTERKAVIMIAQMLAETDPPLVTNGALLEKSVMLLKAISDLAPLNHDGKPSRELVVSEPDPAKEGRVNYYPAFPVPFWLDWQWEELVPAAKDSWDWKMLGFDVSSRTYLQMEYLIQSAPHLPKQGYVASAAFWLFRRFQESVAEKRKVGLLKRETLEIQKISFPFWQREVPLA
jgi:hypothetical protein